MTTIKSITHHTVVLSHTPEGFSEPWDYHIDVALNGHIMWAQGNAFLKEDMTDSDLSHLYERVRILSDEEVF